MSAIKKKSLLFPKNKIPFPSLVLLSPLLLLPTEKGRSGSTPTHGVAWPGAAAHQRCIERGSGSTFVKWSQKYHEGKKQKELRKNIVCSFSGAFVVPPFALSVV